MAYDKKKRLVGNLRHFPLVNSYSNSGSMTSAGCFMGGAMPMVKKIKEKIKELKNDVKHLEAVRSNLGNAPKLKKRMNKLKNSKNVSGYPRSMNYVGGISVGGCNSYLSPSENSSLGYIYENDSPNEISRYGGAMKKSKNLWIDFLKLKEKETGRSYHVLMRDTKIRNEYKNIKNKSSYKSKNSNRNYKKNNLIGGANKKGLLADLLKGISLEIKSK